MEADSLSAWLRLWNGRLDLLDETLHPDFRNVVPGMPPLDRRAVFQLINEVRTRFDVFSVKVEIGPIVAEDLTAGRWAAVAVAAGATSHWHGHSILRAEQGRIIEHYEMSIQVEGEPFPLPGMPAQKRDPRLPRPRRR